MQVKISDTPECREKIEEFNNILNKVCNKKSKEDNQKFRVPSSEIIHKNVSNASTFQEFASGVRGGYKIFFITHMYIIHLWLFIFFFFVGRDSRNVPVPDSSTSENAVAQ